MPISDPGNAATAGTRDSWPDPRRAERQPARRRDRYQRALAGILGVTLGVAILVGGLGVLITHDWTWAVGAVIGWLGSVFISAGILGAIRGDK